MKLKYVTINGNFADPIYPVQ